MSTDTSNIYWQRLTDGYRAQVGKWTLEVWRTHPGWCASASRDSRRYEIRRRQFASQEEAIQAAVDIMKGSDEIGHLREQIELAKGSILRHLACEQNLVAALRQYAHGCNGSLYFADSVKEAEYRARARQVIDKYDADRLPQPNPEVTATLVHSLQSAQEATRRHSIHFGDGGEALPCRFTDSCHPAGCGNCEGPTCSEYEPGPDTADITEARAALLEAGDAFSRDDVATGEGEL